ncbi:hypothetical protein DV738_g5278, partial [Chaetothyriales sp. CBS 135597]
MSNEEAGASGESHPHAASEQPLRFRFKKREDTSKDENYNDDERDPSPTSHPLTRNGSDTHLDPDIAFRESLFDALADDEGADFWQSVYGQPIHTYANAVRNEETGDLEQMDDEEYAQFVRQKMWEKSREGIEAEREQRRQQKLKQRERKRAEHQRAAPFGEAHNNWEFEFEIEASLRRGRRRRDDKRWQGLWTNYLQKWHDLRALADSTNCNREKAQPTNLVLSNEIAWPVESGKREDIDADKIEAFFTKAVGTIDSTQDRSDLLRTILKQERVLWHPDKMQQRYGMMQIDELTMQGITATFQVLDKMWNEVKASAG